MATKTASERATIRQGRVRPPIRLSKLHLAAIISAAVPEEGECPWCSLGFEPCICELGWVLSQEEVDAYFEEGK